MPPLSWKDGVTAYHAKYYAHDLTRRASGGLDRISMSLFDATVDLNPHQIEAALFALHSPLVIHMVGGKSSRPDVSKCCADVFNVGSNLRVPLSPDLEIGF